MSDSKPLDQRSVEPRSAQKLPANVKLGVAKTVQVENKSNTTFAIEDLYKFQAEITSECKVGSQNTLKSKSYRNKENPDFMKATQPLNYSRAQASHLM